ncbi:MAG: four helix bundle protein [Candidatus Wallbacteria bacterium]|nr:four helix bundle protein [Candidatus Wallbacteria bacterium]
MTREPSVAQEEPPLFTKSYDLLLWMMAESTRFPELHRGALVPRLQATALEMVLLIAGARYRVRERASVLERADRRVDELRVLLRVSKDLRLLNQAKYLDAAARLREIGKMIGGWKKVPQGTG